MNGERVRGKVVHEAVVYDALGKSNVTIRNPKFPKHQISGFPSILSGEFRENMAMFVRGSFVITFIFGLALAMASFSVWVHYEQGRRCLEFWGSEAANLIQHAPHVELYEFVAGDETADENCEALTFHDRKVAVKRQVDVSRSPGLIHARHELIMDARFEWPATPLVAKQFEPSMALRFTDGNREALIFLDFDRGQINASNSDRRLAMTKALAAAEQEYFAKDLVAPVPATK